GRTKCTYYQGQVKINPQISISGRQKYRPGSRAGTGRRRPEKVRSVGGNRAGSHPEAPQGLTVRRVGTATERRPLPTPATAPPRPRSPRTGRPRGRAPARQPRTQATAA